MIVANEIRRLRAVANLTVREAAAAARLALTAWSDFENGRRDPSADARERISVALGMPPGYLADALYVCGACGRPLPCDCPPAARFVCRPGRCLSPDDARPTGDAAR